MTILNINNSYVINRHNSLRGQFKKTVIDKTYYDNKHKHSAADDDGEFYLGYTVDIKDNKAIAAQVRWAGTQGNEGRIVLWEKTGADWGAVSFTSLTSSGPFTNVGGVSLYMGSNYNKGGTGEGYKSQAASVYGNRVVAGQPNWHNGTTYQGEIVIWEYVGSKWIETHMSASDLESGDEYGTCVETHGDWIAVGARDHSPSYEGVVYMYLTGSSGWVSSSIVCPLPDGSNYGAEFGASICLTSSLMAVGAPTKEKVFVYKYISNAWVLDATISHPSSSTGDKFGMKVAIYEDTLAVGAPLNDVGGTNAGAVYLFSSSSAGGWTFFQGIAKGLVNGNAGAQMGGALGIGSQRLLIGAEMFSGSAESGRPNAGMDGRAWLFRSGSTSWTLEKTYKPDSSETMHAPRMAGSIALSGESIIIGSKYEADADDDDGIVYIYDTTDNSSIQDAEPKFSFGAATCFNLRAQSVSNNYKTTMK